MTTEQYIRDPRFKAFGCCIKTYDVPGTVWVTHNDLQATFDAIDWSTTAAWSAPYRCSFNFIADSLAGLMGFLIAFLKATHLSHAS